MTHKTALGSGLAIVAIVAALFFVSKPHAAAPAPQQSATTTTVAVTSGAAPGFDTAPAPLPLKPGAITVVSGASTTSAAKVPEAPKEFATLVVGTSTYRTPLTASHLVIDSMRALADANPSFTFDGQQYSGLGFFVDSINGKKSGNGYNWMLYVNGKQADLGASQATIAAGDTVEWKYEK